MITTTFQNSGKNFMARHTPRIGSCTPFAHRITVEYFLTVRKNDAIVMCTYMVWGGLWIFNGGTVWSGCIKVNVYRTACDMWDLRPRLGELCWNELSPPRWSNSIITHYAYTMKYGVYNKLMSYCTTEL